MTEWFLVEILVGGHAVELFGSSEVLNLSENDPLSLEAHFKVMLVITIIVATGHHNKQVIIKIMYYKIM